jgi:hypothetical protein
MACLQFRKLQKLKKAQKGLLNQHGDRCRERRLRKNASENHQCKIVLAMDTGREREREREACT